VHGPKVSFLNIQPSKYVKMRNLNKKLKNTAKMIFGFALESVGCILVFWASCLRYEEFLILT